MAFNTFMWHDYRGNNATRDAKRYASLFMWQLNNRKDRLLGEYVLASRLGKPVAGFCEKAENISGWISHIPVVSLDKTVENWLKNGGTLSGTRQTVEGVGISQLAVDPFGATVGLYQPHHAPRGVLKHDTLGHVCWQEYFSNSAAQAREFYRQLFEWEVKSGSSATSRYWVAQYHGQVFAGFVDLPRHTTSAYWMPYIKVHSIAAVLDELQMQNWIQPVTDVTSLAGTGQIVQLRDINDGCLGLFEPIG